jgi:hypothetical protein
MLVVLALTLIMMLLFAQIFQITGNFVTRHKGVAENDQSARILTTILKNDLQSRTMRVVAPYQPSAAALTPLDSQRRGYLYYSENDPTNDTDDVLQLTIDLNQTQSPLATSGTTLSGRATFLAFPWQPGTLYPSGVYVRPTSSGTATSFVYKSPGLTSGATEPIWNTTVGGSTPDGGPNWTTALSPINQPDGDDGQIVFDPTSLNATINPRNADPNNTGNSRYAEVSYFLRNRNLYRRVLLVRDPYNRGAQLDSQPDDTTGAPLIPGLYTPTAMPGSAGFWNDFDYAARIQLDNTSAATNTTALGVKFHSSLSSESSLDNTSAGGAVNTTSALGRPDNRFGHDQTNGWLARNGAPREFDTAGNFFGRYTQEETSNSNFLFPGSLPAGGSPMGFNTPLTLGLTKFTMSLGNPAAVDLSGGPRRGEDILLTNVLSFDVKILDNYYSEAAGTDANRNGITDAPSADLRIPSPAFADVGHSGQTGVLRGVGSSAGTANAYPAYGPNTTPLPPGYFNNVFDTWHPLFDFDNSSGLGTNPFSGADPAPFSGLPNTSGVGAALTWAPTTGFIAGQVVAPEGSVNPPEAPTLIINGLQYRCTVSGTSGAVQPFTNGDAPSTPPTSITDGTCKWICEPPVHAIQITIKYLDPTQNLLRQVTIVQSLLPP